MQYWHQSERKGYNETTVHRKRFGEQPGDGSCLRWFSSGSFKGIRYVHSHNDSSDVSKKIPFPLAFCHKKKTR